VEITDLLVSRLKDKKNMQGRFLVGVCGRAGAGKTTLVGKISQELNREQIDNITYSGDWRFNLDSAERKVWLREKWKMGMDAYLYAINQYSWWNFGFIYKDLNELVKGKSLHITNAYNRLTGKKDLDVDIPKVERGVIILENCVLGGVENLETLDVIVLVNTPDIVCHERILKKDASRRSLPEIMIRNLVTTYSENIFLKLLLNNFSAKTITCDADGALTSYPVIEDVRQIPVPIIEKTFRENKKATIFCDLEGIIIKHASVPSDSLDDIEFIEGSLEKLKTYKDQGYFLVLTTSRPGNSVFGIVEKMRSMGLEFDQIVCDLPVGPRHIVADSKNGDPGAEAHVVKRDEGIKKLGKL
jgi:uridine kinase